MNCVWAVRYAQDACPAEEVCQGEVVTDASCPKDIDGAVDVPATETRQIALNLLLNACEASPHGGQIGFEVNTDGPDKTGGTVLRLEVVDEGPGLPQSVVVALTQLGVTDPADPPRGLGIRVVRDLVRGLGGRIVAVAGNPGSRITLALPTSSNVGREPSL